MRGLQNLGLTGSLYETPADLMLDARATQTLELRAALAAAKESFAEATKYLTPGDRPDQSVMNPGSSGASAEPR